MDDVVQLTETFVRLFCEHELLKKFVLRTIPTRRGIEIRYTSKVHDPETQWVAAHVERARLYSEPQLDHQEISIANVRMTIGIVDLTVFPKMVVPKYLDTVHYIGGICKRGNPAGRITYTYFGYTQGEDGNMYVFDPAVNSFRDEIIQMNKCSGFYEWLRLIRNSSYKALKKKYPELYALFYVPKSEFFDHAWSFQLPSPWREDLWAAKKQKTKDRLFQLNYMVIAEIARSRGFEEDLIRRNFGKFLSARKTIRAIV